MAMLMPTRIISSSCTMIIVVSCCINRLMFSSGVSYVTYSHQSVVKLKNMSSGSDVIMFEDRSL